MNPTLIEGTSETAPLRPVAGPQSYLPISEAGRTFGTTYFLV